MIVVQKRVPALLAAAAASALLLSACSGGASPTSTPSASSSAAATASPCKDTPSGSEVESVKVSGNLGEAPTVEIPAPLAIDATQRTLAITGTGDETKTGDTVEVSITMYNAQTGAEVAPMQKAAATVDDTQFLPGFVRAIECVPVGSRVVALVDSADAFGTTGSSDSAVKADEDVVIVADILSITPDRATGEPQPEVEGMPKVTLDDDGRPTVTIPDTEAPKDLKLAVLKQGDGEEVQEGDTVSVQYQGTNWTTGKVFDESWGKQIASFQTTGVVKGFSQALVGQKVGSQVLVVIPPALGYGDAGQPSAGIGGTDDLVFVIDILQTSR